MLNRTIEGNQPNNSKKVDIISPKRPKRSETDQLLGDTICIFCMKRDSIENLCAAGALYQKMGQINKQHVHEFTLKLRAMALYLDELAILAKHSAGDVVSNELFYHKNCYKTFLNRYNQVKTTEARSEKSTFVEREEYTKALYFNQITNYIYECYRTGARTAFEVTELELMYADLLHHNNISYVSHLSRFADELISAVPELEQRNVKGKKKVTLFFSHDIDHNLLDDLQEPDFFIKSLIKQSN